MQHLESVIKSRIPGIQSLITKATAELETELCHLGKPIAADAGVRLHQGASGRSVCLKYIFIMSFGTSHLKRSFFVFHSLVRDIVLGLSCETPIAMIPPHV